MTSRVDVDLPELLGSHACPHGGTISAAHRAVLKSRTRTFTGGVFGLPPRSALTRERPSVRDSESAQCRQR